MLFRSTAARDGERNVRHDLRRGGGKFAALRRRERVVELEVARVVLRRCGRHVCFDKKQRDAFEADPKRIWTWIQENISVRNDKEHLTAYTTPGAALDLKIAGEKSQKVLFVAIARSLGIPSRLSPTDGAIEYWDGMKFVAVLEKSRKEAHLVVIAEKSEDWVYHQNWTLAVTDGQGYLTLDFGECTWKDGKLELDIMPGDYRILTGSRLPDGNILGKRYDFHIEKNEVKKVELELRVR